MMTEEVLTNINKVLSEIVKQLVIANRLKVAEMQLQLTTNPDMRWEVQKENSQYFNDILKAQV